MAADIQQYLNLVAQQNATQEKFIATLTALLQPVADIRETIGGMVDDFNVDFAIGSQLDVVGEWVGRSRVLETSIEGVYFSFDTENVGFDQGVWLGPFDSPTGITILPDDQYRLLLYARIAINAWDGTIPGAVTTFNLVFEDQEFRLSIRDNQNMTEDMYLYFGSTLSELFRSLLLNGYLDFRPAGVGIRYYIIIEGADPVFGFGLNNDSVAGFGIGVWQPVGEG